MKHKYAAIILYSVVLLLSSCSQHLTPAKTTTIENRVLTTYEQMVAAAEELDADKMFETILDSEETVIQSAGRIQNRRQALESTRQSFEGLRSLCYEFDQKQVTVLSPTTAEMTVKGNSITVTKKERTFRVSFGQTLHFVLTDAGWKLRYVHHLVETD